MADFKERIMERNRKTKRSWLELIQYVMQSKKPFHLVIYENLLKDPIKELKKIMKFLKEINGFRQENLEERLICLSENLKGTHKRKKRINVDPYTNEMIKKLNSKISLAKKLFTKIEKDFDFSSYKRIIL